MIHLSYEAERIDRITQHNRPFVILHMAQIASLASGTDLGMGFHINGRLGVLRPCCRKHVRKAVRACSAQRHAQIARTLLHHESRKEEHTSELQSLINTSYDFFCLQKKKT